jgi:PTH1 family peptidyl-tRNA hydrolase
MWLIVGLGNPGPKYELTRHNIGFLAIDAMADRNGVSTFKNSFQGLLARFDVATQPCVALKPETYMNKSGISVQQAAAFHKIDLDHIIVVHDELDLPLGDIRIKKGGGNSGHNGLKDITRLLGEGFIRIRLGIGRPTIKGTEADFVLSAFTDKELIIVNEILDKACTAIETIVSEGLEIALRQCQTPKKKPEPDFNLN